MTRTDRDWVFAWFTDEVLDRELGPLDEEWLEHVLAEEDGVQLVISDDDGPVALIGCVWDPEGVAHGVTDLAIDPARRRTGRGGPALRTALTWPGHPPTVGWIAFVDQENPAAFAFFSALGWRYEGIDDIMHRFRSPAG